MNPILLFFFKCFIYLFTFIYSIGFSIWLVGYAICHPCKKFWQVKVREKSPQCLLDPSWGNHGFIQLERVRLHYVENGCRSKPLMLLIHGFPEFWYSWRYQLRDFSKDYWVVALDMTGYGESQKFQKQSSYRVEHIIEDIRQFVLAMGRDKFILIGHDWGGLLVWNFLDYHSNMVEKYVVLNCPHHKSWTKTIATNPKQFVRSWYCFFFQIPFLPELALSMSDFQTFHYVIEQSRDKENAYVTEEDLEAFKYTFSQPGALTCAVNYYRANCGELYLNDSYPEHMPPGLMLFGERDEYLVLDFLDSARKSVDNLQTGIILDASHFVQQDKPVEVNNVIRSFIEG